MTDKDVAEMLDCSTKDVERYTTEGNMPFHYYQDRKVFDRDDVLEWAIYHPRYREGILEMRGFINEEPIIADERKLRFGYHITNQTIDREMLKK